jgi:hypothetical protein
LGSEALVEAITNYYKEGEKQTMYNEMNNEFAKIGILKYEDGFGKMFIDYTNDFKNFDIKNYPFFFDKNSKDYKDFQISINYLLG